MNTIPSVLCFFILLDTAIADPNRDFTYGRIYQPGEKFSYGFKMTSSGPWGGEKTGIGTTIHEVNKTGTEEIVRWSSLLHWGQNFSDQLKDYGFSLGLPPHTKDGNLPNAPPPLLDYHLEFLRFYRSVDSHVLSFLRKKGDQFKDLAPHKSQWGSVEKKSYGMDCFQRSAELVAIDKNTVIFRTKQLPPANCSLNWPSTFMKESVNPSFPNNNGNISQGGPNRLNVSWGTEEIISDITLDRKNGKILKGKTTQKWKLRSKNCDLKFENCSKENSHENHRISEVWLK